jgi:hypothetical protein
MGISFNFLDIPVGYKWGTFLPNLIFSKSIYLNQMDTQGYINLKKYPFHNLGYKNFNTCTQA